ncbi:hypothetical protein Fot_37681 [Forsythia ovata]|uniref:Uncharacterized protein n=1 Tax=Forsythia ovata TaxID=205694 RepID=A0ABD1RZN2_9LAMI
MESKESKAARECGSWPIPQLARSIDSLERKGDETLAADSDANGVEAIETGAASSTRENAEKESVYQKGFLEQYGQLGSGKSVERKRKSEKNEKFWEYIHA